MKKVYFRLAWNDVDVIIAKDNLQMLFYELQSLRKKDEGKWFFISAEFVLDKICKSDEGHTLYWMRRKGMRKNQSVILQSNWTGMEFLNVVE